MAGAPVTAKFAADFSSFFEQVQRAQTSLHNFAQDGDRTAARLQAMVTALDGSKIVAQATIATQAVDRIGGASKLTDTEIRKIQATTETALDKMQRMGLQGTDAFRQLTASADGLRKELAERATPATEGLTSKLGTMAAAFGLGRIVTDAAYALKEWALQAINAAGQLTDLSARTGISVEALQRFGTIARESGLSIEDLTALVGKLTRIVGTGSDGAAYAFEQLGLSIDELRRMDAESRFRTVAEALRQVSDETEASALAYAIWGRQGDTALQLVRQQSLGAADGIRVLSGEQAALLDESTERWDRFKADVSTGLAQMAGSAIGHIETMWTALRNVPKLPTGDADAWKSFIEFAGMRLPADKLQQLREWAGITKEVTAATTAQTTAMRNSGTAVEVLRRQMAELQAATRALSATDREAIRLAKERGLTDEQAAAMTGIRADVIQQLGRQTKAAVTATREHVETEAEFTRTMRLATTQVATLSEEQKRGIEVRRSLGRSEADIAEQMGLTVEALKLYAQQQKANEAATKLWEQNERAITERWGRYLAEQHKEAAASAAAFAKSVIDGSTQMRDLEAKLTAERTKLFQGEMAGKILQAEQAGDALIAGFKGTGLQLEAYTQLVQEQVGLQVLEITKGSEASRAQLREFAATLQLLAGMGLIPQELATQFTALTGSVEKTGSKAKETSEKTVTLAATLKSLSGAFATLAQASGPLSGLMDTVADLTGTMAVGAEAGLALGNAIKAFTAEGATSEDKTKAAVSAVVALAGAYAALEQATNKASKSARVFSGAMQGFVTGATVGSAIPGVGTIAGGIVGALVGAIVGWLRNPGWAQEIKRVGSEFGVTISRQLAESIDASAKQYFQGNRQAAEIFNLDRIIGEGGGLSDQTIGRMTGKLRDVFTLMQTGAMTSEQATTVMNKNFGEMARFYTEQGRLISRELVDIIQQHDALGMSSKAVTEFVLAQTREATAGLTTFFGVNAAAQQAYTDKSRELAALQQQYDRASGDEKARLTARIQTLKGEIEQQGLIVKATGIETQTAAEGMAASILGLFGSMVQRGMSAREALTELAPSIDSLSTQLQKAGLDSGDAFGTLIDLATISRDAVAGPVLDAVDGLTRALGGLHNSGLMNQEMFSALTGQITQAFGALVAQGVDGTQALMLMQPSLQRIYQLQQDFGYQVDASTQKMLDQAVEAGIVGDKHRDAQSKIADAMEKVVDILDRIAKALGADVPNAAASGAKAVEDALARIPRSVDIDINYRGGGEYETGTPAASGGAITHDGRLRRMAAGGLVQGAGVVDSVPALLAPGEGVLSRTGMRALSRLNAGMALDGGLRSELRGLRGDLADLVEQQDLRTATLPQEIARAVRDALLTAG